MEFPAAETYLRYLFPRAASLSRRDPLLRHGLFFRRLDRGPARVCARSTKGIAAIVLHRKGYLINCTRASS
jgi:hypothetical protein